jgi:uncharacterized protein YqgC (DUF456 family)
MAAILLAIALLLGLVLIPFGLPGLWVMVGAVLAYSYLGPPNSIGTWLVVVVALLAALGELLEFVLAGRFARRYGGSRRAAWGAIIGSIVGAIVGVPVPIIGSMIGAFVGAFAGAWVAELTRAREVGAATRVATGALLGRVAAVAAKVGVGTAIIALVMLTFAFRHLYPR